MKYFKVFLFFVAVSISVPSSPVFAQVSRKDQAKAHFQRGNVFYEEGKYLKAIKELKEAYRLIPKPIILLYIANIYKEADLKEEAIQYYRRFLNEARLKDPQRPKVVEILKSLGASPKAPTTPVVQPSTPVTSHTVKDAPKPVKKNKTKKKYKKGELIHTPLEEAQPGHPAKLEVELPDEIKRAWLYVYYRKPGQDKYTKVKMKVDKNDVYYFILPCSVMNGNILQYYIEAVGVSGRRIAGSATDSSPFIVDINKSNPLQPGGKMPCSAVGSGSEEGGNANIGVVGGSSSTTPGNAKPKSFYFAVGSSVATGIFVVASVSMGIMAMNNAKLLEDAQMIPGSLQSDYDKRYQNGYIAFTGSIKDYETAGKMYERTMFITSGLAVISAAAATYFWLDYLKKVPSEYSFDAKFGGSGTASPAKETPQTVLIPLFGKDSAGLGISFRF